MLNILTNKLSLTLFNSDTFKAYFTSFSNQPASVIMGEMHAAKVVAVNIENNDMYSLILAISGKVDGQNFTFKPGQYVDLLVKQNGSYVKRPFTISSPLSQYQQHKTITLTIKKQPQGRITPWLAAAVTVGEQLGVSAAKGHFTLRKSRKDVVFIAGGSGITPFHSLLLSHVKNNPTINFSLLYYAKSQHHVLSGNLALLAVEQDNFTQKLLQTEHDGYCSQAHLNDAIANVKECEVYICGPNNMIENTQALLLDIGVAEDAIYVEQFGLTSFNHVDLNRERKVSFIKTNKDIVLSRDNQKTLLNIAEDNQVPAKYGCRIGICQECKCRKISGVVYNSHTKKYSDTAEEDIQVCISVPVTDVLINI
jgi:ferredoxin-NADP reductase